MRGLTHLMTFWRAAVALLLLAGMLWLANDLRSQTPMGVLGLFGFSLFISLGFILFGQERFEQSAAKPAPEDRQLA